MQNVSPADTTSRQKPTCMSCDMQFEDFEEQRVHFTTAFHRENCRRRAGGLPPMIVSEYLEFLKHMKQKQSESDFRTKRAKVKYHCAPCGKTFSSENAYNQHTQSEKHRSAIIGGQGFSGMNKNMYATTGAHMVHVSEHKQLIADSQGFDVSTRNDEITRNTTGVVLMSAEDNPAPANECPTFIAREEEDLWRQLLPRILDLPTEAEQDEYIWENLIMKRPIIPETRCLFCPDELGSFDALLAHMDKEHGFFIPRVEFCTDRKGLIRYMQEQLSYGRGCIVCSRGFRSVNAACRHMRDTDHCVFDMSGREAEYVAFYDYTPSYPSGFLNDVRDIADNDEELQSMLADVRAVPYGGDRSFMIGKMLPFGRLIGVSEYKRHYAAIVPQWAILKEKEMRFIKLASRTLGGAVSLLLKGSDTAAQDDSTLVERLPGTTAMSENQKVGLLRYLKEKFCSRFSRPEAPTRDDPKVVALDRKTTDMNRDKPFFKRSTLHIYN